MKEEQLGVRYFTDVPGRWTAALSWAMVNDWVDETITRTDMFEWLTQQFGSGYYPGVWRMERNIVYFRDRADAMLFKLIWHGRESVGRETAS